MRIPLITNLIKRRKRSRLRRVMRGYRFLRDSKALNRISDIKRSLTNQPMYINKKIISAHIFREEFDKVEIVCKQYLLARIARLNLNSALLHSFGETGLPVIYYLPPEWRKIIRDHGVKIAGFRTALLWQAFVGMMMIHGILRILKIVFQGIKTKFDNKKQDMGSYVYFYGLALGNLPQPCRDGRSHDIVTWYMQWMGRIKDIDTLCHGVPDTENRDVSNIPVVQVLSPIPALTDLDVLARFIAWGIGATLIAILDLLRGRWWHPLLLNQAALAAQVRIQEPKKLAKEYLFHNSSPFYRPLWTYEAERKKSRITFYFYSTNIELFKRPEGYPPIKHGWQLMNWPHYLVWDEYQAEFVKRAVGEVAKISIVGSIWFHSSAEEIPEFNSKTAAVFDVTPFRDSKYRTMGADFEYFIPKTCLQFLKDIQIVTNDAGYLMLWKRKRKIGSHFHPEYLYFTDYLKAFSNFITIDPDISAHRIIESSTIVISMPFTSTALIARELGKPSCYYDPTELVQKDDRSAHGIEIVRGIQQLSIWIEKYERRDYIK